MAHGSTRRKSRAIVDLVSWFYERHASDVPIVGMALAILTAMRAVSRASVCNLFDKAFAEPYGDAVRKRDEAFFLSAPIPSSTPPSMSGITTAVHTAWDRMSEADRGGAWDKLDDVLALCG